jgi:hypothetical protein
VGTTPPPGSASATPSAITDYLDHDRVTDGDCDTVLDALLHAWQQDTARGARSLMIATDHATVTDLNRRARSHRVATGQVRPDGVTTADGTTIGIGDQSSARRNDRTVGTRTGRKSRAVRRRRRRRGGAPWSLG